METLYFVISFGFIAIWVHGFLSSLSLVQLNYVDDLRWCSFINAKEGIFDWYLEILYLYWHFWICLFTPFLKRPLLLSERTFFSSIGFLPFRISFFLLEYQVTGGILLRAGEFFSFGGY